MTEIENIAFMVIEREKNEMFNIAFRSYPSVMRVEHNSVGGNDF